MVTAAKKRNVRGKSGELARGSYCTPKHVADNVGPWNLDPFSNPRSHIVSDALCSLERGDDGFGDGTPGSYRINGLGLLRATRDTRVWGQPDYAYVLRAVDHYQHTRWCWLLRFDPRTTWFKRLYRMSEVIAVFPDIQFEPPPGVKVVGKGANSFPHALFYRCADDVTDAVKRTTYAWRKKAHGP